MRPARCVAHVVEPKALLDRAGPFVFTGQQPAQAFQVKSVRTPDSETSPHGQRRRIMYVDDEEALVFLMARVLERSGYKVTGVALPEQALQILKQRPQDFDIVVTDLSMPVMSGFHLAREIKEIRADLPVVVTSGYVRTEDRDRAKEIGVDELVQKPDTVEELAQILERVLNR
jgi:CheY-like chemotaxis protein